MENNDKTNSNNVEINSNITQESNNYSNLTQQQPTPIYSNNESQEALMEINKKQNYYEYAMLIFGIITIVSLLVGNGFLLKLGAIFFLLVAIISIVNSIYKSSIKSNITRPDYVSSQLSNNPELENYNYKKKSDPLKLFLKIILIILLIPVAGYALMIIFFIILLMSGGGRMGT